MNIEDNKNIVRKKKKILICSLVVISIALIGIIFGSFFDLEISIKFADPNSYFHAFIEVIGFSLSYLTIPMSGMLIFLSLVKNKNIYIKIIAYVSLILTLIVPTIILGKQFAEGSFNQEISFKPIWAYLTAFLIMVLFQYLTYLFTDKDADKVQMLTVGLILICSMGIQFGVLSLLKKIDCRPRYRYIVDTLRNTTGTSFRNWWEFQPFSAHGDYFKSWPSGHAATSAQLILLSLYAPLCKWKYKNADIVFFSVSLIYCLFICLSRILYGAHFLSDVSFGLLISFGIIAFCYYLGMYLQKVITSKIRLKQGN